jgi:hypothetical protein
MNKQFFKTLWVLSLVLIVGCSGNQQSSRIDDENQCIGGYKYLSEHLQISEIDNRSFIIINDDYCSPCVEATLNWLVDHMNELEKFSIVLSGCTFNKSINDRLTMLKGHATIIEDCRNFSEKFGISTAKPLIMAFENKDCLYYKNLQSETVQKILDSVHSF